MNVVYHQHALATDELTQPAVSLEGLMAQSTRSGAVAPNDRPVIIAVSTRAVKPGAMPITARAALVDREAPALDRAACRCGPDVAKEAWTPDDQLLKYMDGKVILMPHTAVGDRKHGLADLQGMCRKIWRVIDNRRTGRRGG